MRANFVVRVVEDKVFNEDIGATVDVVCECVVCEICGWTTPAADVYVEDAKLEHRLQHIEDRLFPVVLPNPPNANTPQT